MSENEEKKVVSLAGARESKEKEQEKSKDDKQTKPDEVKAVYCSFCERPNYMVLKIIEGPGVNICSECTMICLQHFILEDRIPSEEARKVLEAYWNLSKRT